ALGAVAVVPVGGEQVRIAGVDDRLVGGDDDPGVGVADGGQLLEGQVVLPVVVGVPAGGGPAAVPLAAHRDPAGRLVADGAGGVGVDEVLRGDLEGARGLAELLEVAGPVEQEDRVGGASGGERGPADGDRVVAFLGGVGGVAVGGDGRVRAEVAQLRAQLGVGQQRAVAGGAHGDLHVLAAGDPDGLGAGLQRLRLAVDDRGVALDPLQVQVHHVGAEVGEAPGDGVVGADDHAGQAGEGEPGDVEGAGGVHGGAVQAHLVPDRRHART